MVLRPVNSVLLYHEIGPKPRSSANLDCFCTTGSFRAQMAMLKDSEIPVLTARDLFDRVSSGMFGDEGGVALTFDDGDVSFIEHVLPILDEFEFPSTVFAVAGQLGLRAGWVRDTRNAIPLMSADDLCLLRAHRVEVGSHTMNHRKLPDLLLPEIVSELVESKSALERHIQGPVLSLAYPHGRYNAKVMRLAKAAGYEYAYSTNGQQVLNSDVDRLCIPRKYITSGDTLEDFAKKLGSPCSM